MTAWTDDETDVLNVAWPAGITADALAGALGRNRNSIIGRVHAIGLNKVERVKRKPRAPGVVPFKTKARATGKAKNKPSPEALAEIYRIRDAVASDRNVKVGGPAWLAAVAQCKALRSAAREETRI